MDKKEKEKRTLINNTLDYYFNNSITKYDTINLFIAILNEKVDITKNIQTNLNNLKNN